MKNNNKNIAILIVSLLTVYSLLAAYFVHDDYVFNLDKTIKTSDSYCKNKSEQISAHINSYVSTANTIAEMLSSAKEKYGFSMMPFCEQSLKNICISNPEIASVTVTWEYSQVNPEWIKPVGRLAMKAYMIDGMPKIERDTVDLEGEYVSESYYQMKNGTVHTLFTSPEQVAADYLSQNGAVQLYTIATRILLNGDYIGMVTLELPLKDIDLILQDMPLDYAGKPFLVASDGKIYCHYDNEANRTKFFDNYSQIERNDEIAQVLNEGVIGSTNYVDEKRDDAKSHLTLIPIVVKDSGKPWTLVSEIYFGRIVNQSIRKVVPFFILSFLGLMMMVFVTVQFARKSTNPMQRVITVLQQIDKGEHDKVEHLESGDDEVNHFYQAVNQLAQRTLRTTEFARSIGTGNLNIQYDVENPNALDLALLEMQKNLRHAQQEEENRKQENEKLSWSQNGLAQLGEYLRMNNVDITEFAFNVISFLVKYVKALQGGIFISEEQDGQKYLSLKAAYAFDRKKQLESRVEFGESLVGRCAIEGKYIFLTDVPDGYLYITSGLGENKPQCILLVPLKFEDEVHGVIEIASLNMIEQYQIEFFNNVAERIASSISNIKKNINTAELLNKFRTQSDELAFRESEIEKSVQSIESSKASLEKQNFENEVILDVLSKSCIITQYDVLGVVRDLRDNFLDETGYKMSDILGHNLKEILALTKNDMDNFDKFWNDIIQGKSKSRKFTRGDRLFKETFTLIKDADGYPSKVISVAIPK
ncbi:MAG: GAF domain-containing protein [Bacteroidales bacterium]|nr:GAF domain-containing protein [Bacteroidales bacterium]